MLANPEIQRQLRERIKKDKELAEKAKNTYEPFPDIIKRTYETREIPQSYIDNLKANIELSKKGQIARDQIASERMSNGLKIVSKSLEKNVASLALSQAINDLLKSSTLNTEPVFRQIILAQPNIESARLKLEAIANYVDEGLSVADVVKLVAPEMKYLKVPKNNLDRNIINAINNTNLSVQDLFQTAKDQQEILEKLLKSANSVDKRHFKQLQESVSQISDGLDNIKKVLNDNHKALLISEKDMTDKVVNELRENVEPTLKDIEGTTGNIGFREMLQDIIQGQTNLGEQLAKSAASVADTGFESVKLGESSETPLVDSRLIEWYLDQATGNGNKSKATKSNDWTLGGAQIDLEKLRKGILKLEDFEPIRATRGLLELIFTSDPNVDYITKKDAIKFKEITDQLDGMTKMKNKIVMDKLAEEGSGIIPNISDKDAKNHRLEILMGSLQVRAGNRNTEVASEAKKIIDQQIQNNQITFSQYKNYLSQL